MDDTLTRLSLHVTGLAGTRALARALAPAVGPGFVMHLSGDLGAGKTTFARALLRELGHTGRVRSPTFTLAEPYALPGFELLHFDFYRFNDAREWLEAGFDEVLGSAAAALIEWPEMAGALLPAPDLRVRLEAAADPGADVTPSDGPVPDAQARTAEESGETRRVELSAHTARGRECLSRLERSCQHEALDVVSSVAR